MLPPGMRKPITLSMAAIAAVLQLMGCPERVQPKEETAAQPTAPAPKEEMQEMCGECLKKVLEKHGIE